LPHESTHGQRALLDPAARFAFVCNYQELAVFNAIFFLGALPQFAENALTSASDSGINAPENKHLLGKLVTKKENRNGTHCFG